MTSLAGCLVLHSKRASYIMRKLLLLGGVPCVGKSYLCHNLQFNYWVNVISLDLIGLILDTYLEKRNIALAYDTTLTELLDTLIMSFDRDDVPWIIEGYHLSYSTVSSYVSERVLYRMCVTNLSTYANRHLEICGSLEEASMSYNQYYLRSCCPAEYELDVTNLSYAVAVVVQALQLEPREASEGCTPKVVPI